MLIYFYISGHGFGHASRDIEVVNAIAAKRPEASFVIRSTVARWLFESTDANVDVQPFESDTGVVQIDSLRLDEEATARRAAAFYRDFDARVDREAVCLRVAGADLVLGDIPPLAFAAAARAGVPSVAIGNFTWDWIYSSYPAFAELCPSVLPIIRNAYAQVTRALRLPLHGGFAPMADKTRDVPFVARTSKLGRTEARRRLGFKDDTRLVLASFGAYGADLPYDRIAESEAFTLLNFSRPPADLEYQDVVAAADVVVSKPGYGIVSECIANGTALLYTSRGRFIEYDVMVAEMPALLRCRFISHDLLLAGRWTEVIEALLRQPGPERPRVDGAQAIANWVIGLLGNG